MTAATMNAVADKLSRAARAKGSKDRDSRKDERAAFGRQIRRAGKVSICDALLDCEDEQDDAYELLNALQRAECEAFSDADMEALLALIDATPVVF